MPEDDTKKAAQLRAQAATLKAQAATLKAQANENTKQALKDLENYITQYKTGLKVCEDICTIMNEYTLLQDIYPDIFQRCNCSKNQVKDS
jgi:uncharacterized protein involved in exopolysaccharide biosynthesis